MKEIEQEHPEYVARKAMWRKYRDLYAGGEQLRANAARYLVRRQKEPGDVYAERLERVFYENYVGSIIDWYAATLFRREAVLSTDGVNEAGRRFFSEFAEDCDRKGTGLNDFFRRQLVECLVSGASWVMVDFPRARQAAGSRAEEEALGLARAYLVEYTPEEIINWSRDEHGNLEWAVIRTNLLRKERLEGSGWKEETRWHYLDRERFRIYRREKKEAAAEEIQVVDEGYHALAKLGRVPLFELKVSEGLWLMNKAATLQLEHFNKSNALAWALTMGLFASPVIYSEREWRQVVGESYYIQLGPGDRFGWTEPEGKVYQIAAENLHRLQEEIYRICYLMAQSRGFLSGAGSQSALSKQRDFAITEEVLRAYGDAVKDTMKKVLRAIAEVREDGITVDISGLDEFDMGEFTEELTEAERLLALGIPSETLRREVYRKLAFNYVCDLRQEVKDQIAREIG